MDTSKIRGLDRRKFLGSFSKAAALSTLSFSPLSLLAKAPGSPSRPSEGAHVFLTQPYLQAVSATEMSIRWITQKPSYSWVEITEGGATRKVHGVTDGLVTAYNRIHEIVIPGLTPGKEYSYRVASKEITDFQPYKVTYGETLYSSEFSFTTANPLAGETSWLVLNDIHDRPASFAHLLKLNGDDPYDFVFLNGDMFDYQTDEKQVIDHLLTPCTENFATHKPLMFVRGNHETRGKFARNLKDYFTNPGNHYFTFQYGPVFAIALDTGEDKEDTHPVYAGIVDFDSFREQQALWLEKQLQSPAYKKAKYRVVFMHIPPFYSGDGHGTLHCRKLFSPLFDKYKVDLVISGHTHRYGVHPPSAGNHTYPIIIGGGPTEGKRTLIKVKANRQQLDLQMLCDDGTEAGTYQIKSKRR